jgi:drug/metabolite transporter (DMT)-like permease
MPQPAYANYRLGTFYCLVTAALYATQEPFSFPAAKHLNTIQFVCLTQIALLISIPLVTGRPAARHDLVALLTDRSNYLPLAVLFANGLSGTLLYNFGLSHAHPIIISAILNLSPFWAALVALVIAKVPIPVSPAVFFGCFAGAFMGAMAVAWSQIGETNSPTDLANDLAHGTWVYAIPVPLFSALSGTLIGRWLAKYRESAAVAANFLFANVILIPATLLILYRRGELNFGGAEIGAAALMILGTIIAASVGRIFYQVALTVTRGDNGFVMMFLNLVPALTALVSVALSLWIADLHFVIDPMFFLGSALIAASLFLFSLKSWRQSARPSA